MCQTDFFQKSCKRFLKRERQRENYHQSMSISIYVFYISIYVSIQFWVYVYVYRYIPRTIKWVIQLETENTTHKSFNIPIYDSYRKKINKRQTKQIKEKHRETGIQPN